MKTRVIIICIVALFVLSMLGLPCFADDRPKVELDFSLQELIDQAQAGDADAQCFLGLCYIAGVNTASDIPKGIEWLDKSANQGYEFAMGLMALGYSKGVDTLGIEKNPKKACDYMRKLPLVNTIKPYDYDFTLSQEFQNPIRILSIFSYDEENLETLRREAAAGNASAQYALAVHYDTLIELYNYNLKDEDEKNRQQYLYWLRQAASQGHATAQCQLARELFSMPNDEDEGWYGRSDNITPEVINLLKAAADQGDLTAITNLAYCYLNCETPDTVQAVAYYRQAAIQGDLRSQLITANYYYLGKGVTQDYTEAIKWYSKVAKVQVFTRLSSESLLHLGDCYFYGHGVPQDFDKALEIYNKIDTDDDDIYSIVEMPYYLIGQYYEQQHQEEKALEYYIKGAKHNDPLASRLVADYYYEGSHGLSQDYDKAVELYMNTIGPEPSRDGWFGKIADLYVASYEEQYTQKADSVLLDSAELEIYEETDSLVPRAATHVDLEKYADRDFYKNAIGGDAEAQLKLGKMLLSRDRELDYTEDRLQAAEWLEKAARQGNVEAMYQLGECYSEPFSYSEEESQEEAIQRLDKAFDWYLKAAQNGNVLSQLEVAKRYDDMLEKELAELWFRKAAEGGNAEAQNRLGNYCLDNGKEREAFDWFSKAASQNYYFSYENLGDCYLNGKGVGKDPQQGVYWLEEAIDAGDLSVANILGNLYFNGDNLPQDYSKAVYWYTVGSNYPWYGKSKNRLGECYRDGLGVAKNYTKAVYWFRAAAEDGDTEAQLNLSECYEKGLGVPKSSSQAEFWKNQAEENPLHECFEEFDDIDDDN